ncbi:MAG: hypothetical protein AB3N11_16960 [Arenibacterium sp.]
MSSAETPLVTEQKTPNRYDDHSPVMLAFQPNWPVRVVMFRVFGTAMILSASMMWLLPGADLGSDMMLFKLGISVFFLFCGLALLMRNHADNQPDAYFDPIRNEVRVLQKNDRGRPQTILRRSYESLGSVDFSKDSVTLYDVDGSRLMKLVIGNSDARQSLRSQLNGMVKVTG